MKALSFLVCFFLFVIYSFSQTIIPSWAQIHEGALQFYTSSSVVGENNSLYSIGYFDGIVEFGQDTLISNGGLDIFITKIDSNGNYLWSKSIGSFGDEQGIAINRDSENNYYIVGYFSGSVDFDPNTGINELTSDYGICPFTIKIDSEGNLLWAGHINSKGASDLSSSIVSTSTGVYVIGQFSDSADFDPNIGTYYLYPENSSGLFIQKLDKTTGNLLWVKQISSSYVFSRSVKIDGNENLYIYGMYNGTIDLDPNPSNLINRTTNGQSDLFLLKLDLNGNFLNAVTIGGIDHDESTNFHISETNELILLGRFRETVDFNPGLGVDYKTSEFTNSGFILSLDSSLNYNSVKVFNGNGHSTTNSCVTNSSNELYVYGEYTNEILLNTDYDISPSQSQGSLDIFVVKYDANRNYVFSNVIGGQNSDVPQQILIDSQSNIYITGKINSTLGVDFDPTPSQLNLSGTQTFYVKYFEGCLPSTSNVILNECFSYTSPSGNYVWDSSGIYNDTLLNHIGCDSVITIDLTINLVDTTVSVNQNILFSNATGALYKWLNCDNNFEPILGESNQFFIPNSIGNYAVEINQNGCIDTSSCISFVTNIEDYHKNLNISVYPNPTKDIIYIDAKDYDNLKVEVYNLLGEMVFSEMINGNDFINTNSFAKDGVFFIKVIEGKSLVFTQKIKILN
ncbi:T9SS type A sorting domain-containing protein [Vicingus serpentipes]|uniref:T9SS type A sorting domain-containing protein n=1 Tax=Vicingus serpentipes TaxID=1926625 RepID=A0A5C6RXT0_9FLAO|nr:T9SS type A sorting domain-containing protein [Vicingus serpentipes]TXB66864.1 T9SS type A sorting domain-containing protein [Vicingus serpentipes]